MNLYEILGVSAGATPAQLRAAYRTKSKTAHPDAGGSVDAFAALALAMRVLGDPEARKIYDRTGRADDPTDVEDTTKRAWIQIGELIAAIITHEEFNAATTDLPKTARQQLARRLDDLTTMVPTLRLELARVKDAVSRVDVGDGGEHVRRILDEKVQRFSDRIKAGEQEWREVERALELVGQVKFDRSVPTVSNFFSMVVFR